MRTEWKGVFTALVTPFDADGNLDKDGLADLIHHQLDAGIHGLVPCGTTGESPVLTHDEWKQIIEITVAEAKGKAWVVAGSGTNNTAQSCEKTKEARALGADGALVITPYYNKPTPEGLYAHFSAVQNASGGFPMMAYNVPSRTGSNMTTATQMSLVEKVDSVVAIKEASGNLGQVWEVAQNIGDIVAIFSGDDSLNMPIFDVGGHGAVSVLSNVIPDKMVEQWDAYHEDDRALALGLHQRFAALASSLFIEASPSPAKFVMREMGLPVGEVRLPLVGLLDGSKEVLTSDIKDMGLV